MSTYDDLRARWLHYLQKAKPEQEINLGRPFEELLRAVADVIDDRTADDLYQKKPPWRKS